MRACAICSLFCIVASAGCTTQAPVHTAGELPTGFYGTYQDNDVGAINQSAWALASPERTKGNPVEAIKAIIAVDWLADELEVNPRWVTISPLTKQHMLQARIDVRHALSISADAPSRTVVAALLETIWDLQSGASLDTIQALRAFPFTLTPGQTFDILLSFPYVASANIATSEAATEILTHGGRI
jgi:hypothetical protein